jgi:pSer/pThr/pTyr-binding forkhead associated (FHA) protein
MKVSLVVLNAGKSAGHAIPVTLSQFIIGRDPQCNLRPASAMISKRHCAVLIKSGKLSLRDFDSTNGTFLNDKPVKGEVPLQNNDVLKVGPLAFKVVVEKTTPVDKPTPPPTKSGGGSEEDVAAMLLAIKDEDGGESISSKPEEVPGGSTVMDIVALPNLDTESDAAKPAAASTSSATPPPPTQESGDKKPADKKQAQPQGQHGSARDAAKAILEKYSKRNRGPAAE